jgi:hypothetical protein
MWKFLTNSIFDNIYVLQCLQKNWNQELALSLGKPHHFMDA